LLPSEYDYDSVIDIIKPTGVDKKSKAQAIRVYTNNYFNNGERTFLFESVLDRKSS